MGKASVELVFLKSTPVKSNGGGNKSLAVPCIHVLFS